MPPPPLADRLVSSLRAGGWTAGSFAVEATTRWAADGTVAHVQELKRADAAVRQRAVGERLAGFTIRADPGAYHCWWELPAPWRAETFVAAAARRGIGVTPAAAFTIGTGHSPNAVRLAISAPPLPVLDAALDMLATLARGLPGDDGVE